MNPQTIVLTGAAGEIGRMLRTGLAREGVTLRLVDIQELEAAGERESVEIFQGSITDGAFMQRVCDGADAVIHMASLLDNHTWENYLEVNINGTRTVLEAARLSGIRRIVIASSHHAVGFHPKYDGASAPDYMYPRPDSFYGVTKVTGEALGSLYHDRYGMNVICLRIASYQPVPSDTRQLGHWLSPTDCLGLVDAALSAEEPGYKIVWGVSDNTRRWMSLDEAESIGYKSADNAEDFAEEVLGNLDPDNVQNGHYGTHFLGGAFCVPVFDEAAAGFHPNK